MWVTKLLISLLLHCWLISCPVGGLAGGCGAGCISQDTYLLYHIILFENLNQNQVADVLKSAGLEVTNFIRVEVGRSGAE